MKVLVAFYSRTGNTKRVGEVVAEELRKSGNEVTIEEIGDRKNRKGVFGWLSAGLDAAFRRATPIEPPKADIASFDFVVIGTPVWAWRVSTSVRTYCAGYGPLAKRAAFYYTMGSTGGKSTFKEMEALCGKTPTATLALKERHIKKDDADNFRAKVKEFAAAIVKSS